MNLAALPQTVRYLLRCAILLTLPIATFFGVLLIGNGLYNVGRSTGWFHLAAETFLAAAFVVAVISVISLCIMWTGRKHIAQRLVFWSIITTAAFLGTSGVMETVEGNKILAVADSFKPPAELERKYDMNADEFVVSPALVPCWDLMGEGCPHINRAWNTDRLDREDLTKILADSKWSNIKIQDDECNLLDSSDNPLPRCDASGVVEGYKVDASIMELRNDIWELRIYLRDLDSIR